MRRARASMQDVAKEAGVSHSTASRALRGEAKVSEHNRKLVQEAAERLGYFRDLRAADLASSHASTVGLLIRASERPFYGELAARIQEVTDREGLDLLIANGGDDVEHQMKAVRNLLGHGACGILIASGRAVEQAVEYAASFVPTVGVGFNLVRPGVDAVVLDPSAEADLVSRVVEFGHRHVAVTASRHPEAHTLHARTAGFATRLVVAGVKTTLIPVGSYWDAEAARQLENALEEGATAVMAGDDSTALQVLEFLKLSSVDCPGDVSVTGFDGVGPFRSSLLGFTTVEQPVAVMAERAVNLLQSRMEGNEQSSAVHTVPGQVITGRTLAAAHPA